MQAYLYRTYQMAGGNRTYLRKALQLPVSPFPGLEITGLSAAPFVVQHVVYNAPGDALELTEHVRVVPDIRTLTITVNDDIAHGWQVVEG